MECKSRFEVAYYSEAWEFLQQLDDKTKEKIASNINKARYVLDPEIFKKLTGDIWEFRTLWGKRKFRLLAFWDKRDNAHTLVIATHGFIKKTSKVPQKEIDRALSIMNEYLQENK